MDYQTIMALDVGEKRIGIALANTLAKLPGPFKTVEAEGAIAEISDLVKREKVREIVVGLPRNLSGAETSQTKFTENFIKELSARINIPVNTIDEAVTSAQAEAELKSRGKPYVKADIDSLAATYILEDYLNNRSDKQ